MSLLARGAAVAFLIVFGATMPLLLGTACTMREIRTGRFPVRLFLLGLLAILASAIVFAVAFVQIISLGPPA